MRIRKVKQVHFTPSRYHASGMTLIELMIAMLLGLLVVAAAGGMFLANKRVYGSTETVNRIQENSRAAFEIMSRDVREAGGNPCGAAQQVNMLNSRDSAWWAAFAQGLRGYDDNVSAPGTGTAAARTANTDAIDLHLANRGDYAITAHSTPSSTVDLNTTSGLTVGEIVMVCNAEYSLIFQITQISSGKLSHDGGNGAPGNCGQEFQFETPGSCSGASNPNGYCMMVTGSASAQCVKYGDDPAALVRVQSLRWYVGNNGRGGTSLYRAVLQDKGGAAPAIVSSDEIVEGVSDMQLEYRSFGSSNYVAAGAVTDWRRVNAVRIRLALEGVAGAMSSNSIQGTDGETLGRELAHVVAVRNREGVL